MFRLLHRYQLITDVVVGGLFALLAMPIELGAARYVDLNAFGTVVVCLLFGGALTVRRLAPALSLTIAWAGAAVQMLLQRPPGFADVAIFAVLYATAAYGSRRVFWSGFASTIVGAAVITAYLFAPYVGGVASGTVIATAAAVLLAALFGLGLSWTVGALVRTGIRARENRLAQERAETQVAAETERTRIARDMHDVVAHSLAVVIAQADGARYAAPADPQAATDALGAISTTARAALSDVRLLLTQLRHSQGDGPQPTIADLEQLYAHVRSAGVDVRVDVDPAPRQEPPTAVQLAVYRILQEALTNALRHGEGGPVDVALAWHPDRVQLTVRNPAAEQPSGDGRGHGLIGMRERAQLVGGTLEAGALDGVFVVAANLPIGAAE